MPRGSRSLLRPTTTLAASLVLVSLWLCSPGLRAQPSDWQLEVVDNGVRILDLRHGERAVVHP